ncbi:MAG: Alpha-D-kanosaminyltransferase [Syntrophorhabdus sp. PtaB.Bin027]|nr:MAG: Alpha-D-kanosaminyltransferase [Syntrophorhabdus sp. PtaB.Bin027]
MKILYVIPYDWGGMAHYTIELANAVAEYEDVAVLVSNGINTDYFSNRVKIYPIFNKLCSDIDNFKDFISIKNFRSLLSYKNIKIIDDLNPDVIHFTTPISFPLPIFLKLSRYDKKYPIVYTNHYIHQDSNFWIEHLGAFQFFLDQLIKFKKIVVHTSRDRDLLLKKGYFSPKQLVIIPHGINSIFTRFQNVNKITKLEREFRYILFFGYIREYKGLRYLIEAASQIKQQGFNVKVIIAGEGDMSSYIHLIDEVGDSLFEIHNHYISDSDVNDLFLKSEMLILPYSQMTGQSGVLNVALAYGKPIVTTNVWGFDEIIKDGINGFIVPPKNPDALANVICKLLSSDDLLKKMNSNVIETASDLSLDKIAKKHIEVYKDVDSPR